MGSACVRDHWDRRLGPWAVGAFHLGRYMGLTRAVVDDAALMRRLWRPARIVDVSAWVEDVVDHRVAVWVAG